MEGGNGYANGNVRRSNDDVTTAAVGPFVVIFGVVGAPTGRRDALSPQ